MASYCGPGSMTCLLEAWWYVRVVLPTSGCILWRPLHVAYCTWRGLLCSDWHSFTHRGRRLGIFYYKPGPSRVSGFLTDVIDMSWGKHGSLDMCFWSWFPETFPLGYKVCIPWQWLATWSEWMEVWYPISCWRSCESRGIELCAR